MSQLLRDHSWAILSVSIVLVIGFWGAVRSAEAWNTVARLEREGITVEAEVTALRDSLPLARSFYATTTYSAEGQTFTRENRIQRGVYEGLTVGDTLTLRYDPADPAIALPPDNRMGAISLTLTSAAFVLAGVGSAVYYVVAIRRIRHAQERRAALWDEAAERIAQAAAELRAEQAAADDHPPPD